GSPARCGPPRPVCVPGGHTMSDTATATDATPDAGDNPAEGDVDTGQVDQTQHDTNNGVQGSQSDDPKLAAARDEAAANRVKAREANEAREAAEQAAQQANDMIARLQQALGGDDTDDGAGDVDPTERVSELTSENETLRAEVAELRRNEVVRAQAGDEYDAQALLDSRAFTDAVGKLDQDADDYAAQVADAIKTAAENTPRFRVGQAPTRGGTPIPGGSGEGSTTQAEFDAMGYRERVALKQADPTLYA